MVKKSLAGPESQRRVREACASAWTVLRECKGDLHTLAVEFQGAVIARGLRGNAEAAKQWKKDCRMVPPAGAAGFSMG